MDLPKIPKDQLPEEVQDMIDGDAAEFEPLGTEDDLVQPMKQKKSERQLRKTIDELTSLNKIFQQRQNMNEKTFVRKMKKTQKYYRSGLYEASTLDKKDV
ncbi:hypothetical protein Syn7803C72_201 [Synechococcus phage ACG-2014d]|jgi:hypothetical protein|uniref:Uncharacterized protein n=1 Tax=Synechococcus phage ACG-2014d TaxID=1493509 RepID=A0A0E3ENR6_9CAUD|nr:hypothetical protein AAJ59_gp201 [Synechococcus phage ACG-2014d]YP_010355372.1 hypothetical protein M1M12_gp203 [Synechococcus phage ACG-2014d]AIX14814.1 hypothetical protein Syn7803C45_203 [Synechococcus phage ACG-2014d]AIX15031.1 hypothetical protein Syn7803C46_200 [Synechococcus phage ACG-2014d]AIX15458.1 hypothetical protein Syn7803C48_200 [Synechococcus phage ACG-2014d]AIX15679.1 hypothetical protein Syn7803C49_203 [Synechococcus phage ACG-2014d]AIX16107.1 hypothetical protein Syn7803